MEQYEQYEYEPYLHQSHGRGETLGQKITEEKAAPYLYGRSVGCIGIEQEAEKDSCSRCYHHYSVKHIDGGTDGKAQQTDYQTDYTAADYVGHASALGPYSLRLKNSGHHYDDCNCEPAYQHGAVDRKPCHAVGGAKAQAEQPCV